MPKTTHNEPCPPLTSPSADGTCLSVTLGPLFNLTDTPTAPNGAWSWFEDERAIIDASNPAGPRLLVSSVSSAANGDPESGDIDLLWRDMSSGAQGHFELHNRLERDDHDSAALFLRPDGRYLAMYSRHIGDEFTRWRISTQPHNPSAWQPAQTLSNGAGTTYNNVYHLPNEGGANGRLYNFTRALNFDPTVQISEDYGSTWRNAGKLLTQGGGGDRPYLRYAADTQRIHFVATEEHPRDFLNSVYHGYVENGMLFDSYGRLVDPNIFDASGVSPTQLTRVFRNGTAFGGTTMNRAWTISLELDNLGLPVAIFSARANDSPEDHRFFYTRFDGHAWQTHEMAAAGGFLYPAERDYTGLAAIDPNNPNTVYVSTPIDPRSGERTPHYELYRGITENFGGSWAWEALTEASSVDNLRPVVPSWNGKDTAVVWMRGAYNTYTNWTSDIVGVQLAHAGRRSLLWRGGSAWDGMGTNWDAGGGATTHYQEGDELAFDDSASSSRIQVKRRWQPSGMAFNNLEHTYTLRGAAIGGAGGLRVLGGGTVRLFNGNNRFSGPTQIINGRLVLGQARALGGSKHIYIGPQGLLEASRGVRLRAQQWVVQGRVLGTLRAGGGSAIQLHEQAVIEGAVKLAHGTLSGRGRIAGKLLVGEEARIVVGEEGAQVASLLGPSLYIDATSGDAGNTRFATGEVFNPATTGSPGDGQWKQRAFGASNTIYESSGDGMEDAPALSTRIEGLLPGSRYRVSAMFWDAGPGSDVQDWPIRAGLASHFSGDSPLPLFANGLASDAADLAAQPAVLASSLAPYSRAPSVFTEGNRTLFGADLGETTVKPDGSIAVYIDDMPATLSVNQRSWYDGVVLNKVEIVPELVRLTIQGELTLNARSSLLLDIYSAENLDQLQVKGKLEAAGALIVTLHPEAPTLQAGDSFAIIQSEWINGEFDSLSLPELPEGLGWNIDNLYWQGVLEVVALP